MPAAVIVMEVGTHYEVYVLRAKACFIQPLDEGNVEVVEEMDRMRAAVACAGINQHHTPVDLENPALEDKVETVILVEEMRRQPMPVCGQQFRVRCEISNPIRDAQLFDAMQCDSANSHDRHVGHSMLWL